MNTDEYRTKPGQAIADKLIEAIEKDEKIASTYSLSVRAICDTIIKAIALS